MRTGHRFTAVLAARALGPHNVTTIAMPSRYTASMSNEDAGALARHLGVNLDGEHLFVGRGAAHNEVRHHEQQSGDDTVLAGNAGDRCTSAAQSPSRSRASARR